MNARVKLNDSSIVAQAINDSLQNMITSMGSAVDPQRFNQFVLTIMNRQQLEAAYRSDWLSRKIIDIPAFDATREWRQWQATQEQITLIEQVEKQFNVQKKLQIALQKARLYGGAALVMGVNQGGSADEIDLNTIKQGDLKFVHVVSRYELTAGPIETNLDSPYFGEPQYYQRGGTAGTVRFHPSRVVRLIGMEVPDTDRSDGWGDPVLQIVNDAVMAASTVSQSIAQLVNEAKLDVIGVPNLTANLADPEYEARLKKRFGLAASAKSIWNMLLLDKEEEWKQIQRSFSSLPDTMQMYLLIASGAADIPATRLLGQSPAGLSATGESDTRNYYDRVKNEQKTNIGPALSRLDEVLIRSALGSRPAEIFYNWNSLWQLDDVQKADLAYKKAQTFQIDANANIIDQAALKQGRENQLIEDGTYPGFEQALQEAEAMQQEGELEQADPANPENNPPPNTEQQSPPNEGLSENNDGIVGRIRAFDARKQSTKRKGKKTAIKDAAPRTLYVSRPVVNASAIISFFKDRGFPAMVTPKDMHVTLAYSTKPVDWMLAGEPWGQDDKGNMRIAPGGARIVEKLGNAVVLLFSSSELTWRWRDIKERTGAEWKWPDYQPHVTLTYNADDVPPDLLASLKPYQGEIVFGPEQFEEVNPNAVAAIIEDAIWTR